MTDNRRKPDFETIEDIRKYLFGCRMAISDEGYPQFFGMTFDEYYKKYRHHISDAEVYYYIEERLKCTT